MLAITFALPEESHPLLARLQHGGETAVPYSILGSLEARECLLIHTGMGQERARERLEEALEEARCLGFTVTGLLSAGYAGALQPELEAGALFLADETGAELLEPVREALAVFPVRMGRLATSPTVLDTPEQKAAFARETGADAVDMETTAIAAVCRERGIPFVSLRVISDAATERLAVPFSLCMDPVTERPRVGVIVAHLLRHPWRIPSFLGFAKRVRRGAEMLAEAIGSVAKVMPG